MDTPTVLLIKATADSEHTGVRVIQIGDQSSWGIKLPLSSLNRDPTIIRFLQDLAHRSHNASTRTSEMVFCIGLSVNSKTDKRAEIKPLDVQEQETTFHIHWYPAVSDNGRTYCLVILVHHGETTHLPLTVFIDRIVRVPSYLSFLLCIAVRIVTDPLLLVAFNVIPTHNRFLTVLTKIILGLFTSNTHVFENKSLQSRCTLCRPRPQASRESIINALVTAEPAHLQFR